MSVVFERLMISTQELRTSPPKMVAGDKGYSYPTVRSWLRSRGAIDVIPQRSDPRQREPGRAFSREVYRGRNAGRRTGAW